MRINKELYNEFLNLLKKANKAYVKECSVDKQKKKILYRWLLHIQMCMEKSKSRKI